jgi:anti-anti-sigma factor
MSTLGISRDGHGFALSGELDMATAPQLAAAFSEVLPSDRPLMVDARQLSFMDSSGIQAIIAACKVAADSCIVLHGVHGEVQKVLEITGIDVLPNLHVIPCTSGVTPDDASEDGFVAAEAERRVGAEAE